MSITTAYFGAKEPAPRTDKPTHVLRLGRIFSVDDPRLPFITEDKDNPFVQKMLVDEHRQRMEASAAGLERRLQQVAARPVPSPDETAAQARIAAAELALAEHAVSLATFRVRQAAAQQPIKRLSAEIEDARRQAARLEDDLLALNVAELGAVERWAAEGRGDSPTPDVEKRRTLAIAQAQAKRRTTIAEAALIEARAALNPSTQDGQALGTTTSNLVAAVLMEHAEVLGHRLNAALSRVVDIRAELRALNAALNELGGATMTVPGAGQVSPPAIAAREFFYPEERISAPGFWLRAHEHMADIVAFVRPDEIKAKVTRWGFYRQSLLNICSGCDADEAREGAALLRNNAALLAQLAERGIEVPPPALDAAASPVSKGQAA